jgi:hypothetical protein
VVLTASGLTRSLVGVAGMGLGVLSFTSKQRDCTLQVLELH